MISDHDLLIESLASKSLAYQKWALVVSVLGILVVIVGNAALGDTSGIVIALSVIGALIVLYSFGRVDRRWIARITAVNSLRLQYRFYLDTSAAVASTFAQAYRTALENNCGYAIAEKRMDLAEYLRELIVELDRTDKV